VNIRSAVLELLQADGQTHGTIKTIRYQLSTGQEGRCSMGLSTKKKLNSSDLVRKRTIPKERPPLVGKGSANFFG
jgi:hypothetical protein